ncbi:MAG: NUDIX hydrolase [Bacteroidetes bacterium]|nr:MAG: NUDIX hydrolase [Bacteroidota bacterium]MBL1144542.1 NUDIX hydrolase [Bacteroidota bacterium]MCB0803453.1 NUDIX hydrolase [Flavobacteriales bacterium]NOG57337.1 NUDIX hydrolase [Bacteroidota bacterium]
MNNPWKKLKSTEVYENPWIKVTNHEVLNAANKPGIYGTVHFKNIAIGILPIDKNGYTYIVGQYRFPLEKFSWEIPEGGGKHNVDPLETAKRELLEETGVKAKEWSELIRINTSNSVTDEYGIIYLAKDIEVFESNPDEDEDLVVKKLHFDELYEMVMRGEIMDSLSVAAVLKYKLMLLESKT